MISPQSQLLFHAVWAIWSRIWWIILPAVLFPTFWKMWMFYINRSYLKSVVWVMLLVRVPQNVLKTPKAMEQIFAASHGTYSFGLRFMEKYWYGQPEMWTSFEIMADAAGPHFYIRAMTSARNMIESAVYAQYPDAEIEEAEDYVEKFPVVLPNEMYDLHGSDYVLIKDQALPIRTYEEFESINEDEKIDTISTLMEALSHHAGDETTWIHVMVRPTGGSTSDWVKKAQEFRDKIIGRKSDSKPKLKDFISAFFGNFWPGLTGGEVTWPEEKKGEKPALASLTTSEKDQVEAIDKKTAKLAFDVVIRWIYIDRKERLDNTRTKGVAAWAKQFVHESLNGLKPNLATYTLVNRQPFKKRKAYIKKRKIYEVGRGRKFAKKGGYSVMNIEELATIYHFPSATVKTPMLGRIEAKKGTPPASLPIE